MQKAIVIADNFHLIHIGHMLLLKAIDNFMKRNDIENCFILISQESDDMIGFHEKENMLQKLINNDSRFEIVPVECLKIHNEIKELIAKDFTIKAVFTEPNQANFIENSIMGLPTKVIAYKHNINTNELDELILSNKYQDYCKYMPTTLWNEFSNLKEIYSNKKISENKSEENIMRKINEKDIVKMVETVVEKQLNNKTKTIKTTKKELMEMIEKLVVEKLTGYAFNAMHELKNDIQKEISKITKSKWLLSISNIGKKEEGIYMIKMIGSGNNKLNVMWGENIEGDFTFSTSTSLTAGDEFTTSLYQFMLAMVEKKDAIKKILNDAETKINSDLSDDMGDDLEDENLDNGMNDMSSGVIDNMETPSVGITEEPEQLQSNEPAMPSVENNEPIPTDMSAPIENDAPIEDENMDIMPEPNPEPDIKANDKVEPVKNIKK